MLEHFCRALVGFWFLRLPCVGRWWVFLFGSEFRELVGVLRTYIQPAVPGVRRVGGGGPGVRLLAGLALPGPKVKRESRVDLEFLDRPATCPQPFGKAILTTSSLQHH